MIKSFILKNLQPHKLTRFIFSSGINSIIGVTDSGKSSVMRGLKQFITNRPLGLGFRSNWCKEDDPIETILRVEEGTVKKIKSESKNIYDINGEELLAGNSSPPEPVQDLLNLSDINTQWQFNAPFLLSASPPEVGRYLNKITNLDKIDTAFSKIETKKRENKRKLSSGQDSLKKELDKLEEFEYIPKAEKEIEEVEKKMNELSGMASKVTELRDIIEEIIRLREDLKQYKNLDRDISYLESIEGIHLTYEDNKKSLKELKGIVENIKKYRTDILVLDKEIDELTKQLIKEVGDKCPFCGSKITKDCLDHILNE